MAVIFLETPGFPDDIAYGSAGGPEFKTHIFEGNSGHEQRNIVWALARGRWNVSQGIRDKADMDVLRSFFNIMRGRGNGFRFKDWSDYLLASAPIGTGDSADAGATGTAVWNINKTYTVGAQSYVRRIFKPVDNAAFILSVAGVPVVEGGGNDYTVDYTTGIITFNVGSIPTTGQAITLSGEFDVPCRFDNDHMSASHDGFQAESWSSIGIVEILLD